MRLESALWSSSSGLGAHGTAISVVGDNIANVNTVGFKRGRAEFNDLFAEGIDGQQSIAGPTVGNGVEVSTTRNIQEPGIIETTGRSLDLAIEGNGFFLVGDVENPQFSRAGNFSLNSDGNIVNINDKPVLGVPADFQEGDEIVLAPLSLVGNQQNASATTELTVSGNLNSALPVVDAPNNIDSFRDLQVASSFIYNGELFDSLGQSHQVSVGFFKTDVGTFEVQAYVDGADTGGTPGEPVPFGEPITLEFDGQGQLANAEANITGTVTFDNGSDPLNATIDLSNFQQVASQSAITDQNTDGAAIGSIEIVNITSEGIIRGTFSNGRTEDIGRIVLADFPGVDGLIREGGTEFGDTIESGESLLGLPTINGYGSILEGAIERSNVEIANEFISLVVYQQGYQANSQAFSTTSDLLAQTIQLIR